VPGDPVAGCRRTFSFCSWLGSVYKVYLSPLCISEFSLKICTERIVKELVLGAVYRLTTQAQDFSRESEQFCLVCIYMLSCDHIMIDICKCVCWFLATVF